jgi:hypothetical protein
MEKKVADYIKRARCVKQSFCFCTRQPEAALTSWQNCAAGASTVGTKSLAAISKGKESEDVTFIQNQAASGFLVAMELQVHYKNWSTWQFCQEMFSKTPTLESPT